MNNRVLQIDKITKYYGPNLILDEVSLALNRTERAALVGENGAGKTTLAKIILGQETAENGAVQFSPGVAVGYLPQETVFAANHLTIQDYLEQSTGRLNALARQMRELEIQMASGDLPPAQMKTALAEYGLLQEEFEQKDGYGLPYRFEQVLAGLELAALGQDRPLATLSGGECTRVALAALLLQSPDLLILDEPTNHLDFKALAWLESYLAQYANALLVISHDRRFLNTVVNRIVELSIANHRLTVYAGNYDFYMQERERLKQKQMAEFWEQREEIKKLKTQIKAQAYATPKKAPRPEDDKFIAFFKQMQSNRTRSKKIRAAKQQLAHLLENKVEAVARRWEIDVELDAGDLGSKEVIGLADVSKSYPGKTLFSRVTETICNGDHLALVAPNGAGKTTLLKIILGALKPDAGRVKLAPQTRLGYLDQNQESLDLGRTVLEQFSAIVSGTEVELRAQLHRYGLFSGDQVFQPVGTLSIGQRRKLQLAMLIAQQANVLLLDEPTNHLDLDSLEEFENALCAFKGTIIAATHDRWFIDKFAGIIWELKDGRIFSSVTRL